MTTLATLVCAVTAGIQPATLTPEPKSMVDSGERVTVKKGQVALVIGERASDPERYAAEELQRYVLKRYRLPLPIVTDRNPEAQTAKLLILVGRRQTNTLVDGFCAEKGVALSESDPGFDGFVIDFAQKADGATVLAGGSNERGVTYAALALFDLLQPSAEGPVLPLVTIRDKPSIPWRGHPSSRLADYLEPGALDSHVRCRINYIDMRWTPKGSHTTAFGIPPDGPIDVRLFKKVIAEAHRRGLFVYGTVGCAVPPEKIGSVEAMFLKLIALGVDGLWISYDDPGPGVGADRLVDRVLRLGERQGFTGHRIAITPPIHGYQNVDDDWNRSVAKVPGAKDMLWFFTRVPQAADVTMARQVGIASLPGWWHNWPRVKGGVLYRSYGGESLYAKDRAYVALLPLSVGWGAPEYPVIACAPAWTDTVHVWGGIAEDLYVVGPIGIWAWNPEAHDWDKTSRAIYSDVFGAAQVADARRFDELYLQLNELFVVPERRDVTPKRWPSRLKDLTTRDDALEILDQMDAELKKLEAQATRESILDEKRLRDYTLTGMRDAVRLGRVIAGLEFPDYKYADLRDKALALIAEGKIEEAKPILAPYREEIARNLAEVKKALRGFKKLESYTKGWDLALHPRLQPEPSS